MRLTRVAACTTATLLTLATAGPAVAATGSSELLYSSSTSTGVVQVVLNLPVALAGVPNPVELTLLGTDAVGFHGTPGQADVAAANSYLAGGSLVLESPLSALLSPLNRTVSRDLAHPGTQSQAAVEAPGNPLDLQLSLANQSATVHKGSRAVSSTGSLAEASLGSLSSLGVDDLLAPLLVALNGALATVVDAATPLTEALAGLTNALGTVQVPNPLAPVLGGPAMITTPALTGAQLADSVNGLPEQIAALQDTLLNGAAVKLVGISTEQAITPSAASVLATGGSALTSVELFGGLVTVTATEAKASALAGTTRSAAESDASATLIDVTISDELGDLLTLVASDSGITASLLGGPDPQFEELVQNVNDALGIILTELTGLLTSLNSGASLIKQGTVSRKMSADGRNVEAHAVPAEVTLGLPVAPELVTLSIGKADAVSALSLTAPNVVTPVATPQLPQTGGSEQAALLALGLLTIAGATVVMRRRTTA